jgi:hypothetical protein
MPLNAARENRTNELKSLIFILWYDLVALVVKNSKFQLSLVLTSRTKTPELQILTKTTRPSITRLERMPAESNCHKSRFRNSSPFISTHFLIRFYYISKVASVVRVWIIGISGSWQRTVTQEWRLLLSLHFVFFPRYDERKLSTF